MTAAPAVSLDLAKAVATLKPVLRTDDEFDTVNVHFKASLIGRLDDYVEVRRKQGKGPLTFRLSAVQAIVNPTLSARFENDRTRLAALGRSAEQLKLKYAFHGTRATNIPRIAKHGLLRVGHALNPSTSTDAGWFGSPKEGVYLSQHCDYALKYSNDLVPLNEGDRVDVVMFRVVTGRYLHVPTETPAMSATAGYDSHASANFLEWYVFREEQCLPVYVLTVQAVLDVRTSSDDKVYAGAAADAAGLPTNATATNGSGAGSGSGSGSAKKL